MLVGASHLACLPLGNETSADKPSPSLVRRTGRCPPRQRIGSLMPTYRWCWTKVAAMWWCSTHWTARATSSAPSPPAPSLASTACRRSRQARHLARASRSCVHMFSFAVDTPEGGHSARPYLVKTERCLVQGHVHMLGALSLTPDIDMSAAMRVRGGSSQCGAAARVRAPRLRVSRQPECHFLCKCMCRL